MKSKYWAALLVAVIVLCAASSIFLFLPSEDAVLAEIRSDGAVNRVVNLSTDQEFTVSCPGGYNTVTVKNGMIAVTQASCPDGYCMKQGFCNGGRAIVCLPNKLVITFLGESEIDGALG